MDTMTIFGLQFALSLLAWGAAARWLAVSHLEKLSAHEALSWLILPHTFRHLGLVFLVPGVVARPLPEAFPNPAAYGDLLAGLLALAAFAALRSGKSFARPLAWLFNIVGTMDLLYAVTIGTLNNAAPAMGATWYIPTFVVPLLLITHGMIFVRLVRGEG